MKRVNLVVGAVLVGALVSVALLALVWTPYDPVHIPSDVSQVRLQGPSVRHWLGTDNAGIDVLSRLMAGATICLEVGLISVAIGALVGVPLGIVAGMRGGRVDAFIRRACDIAFAFPALLLAIVFAGVFGASTASAMTAIGLASIPAFARVARAAVLPVAASDFVLAARASGTTGWGIARRHVWPNIAPVIGVQASVSFALAILAEAGLSYLGLGTPEPAPTWGRMLKQAQVLLWTHPLQSLWPGLAIALAVLGFNALGDGLRDALDPRLKDVR